MRASHFRRGLSVGFVQHLLAVVAAAALAACSSGSGNSTGFGSSGASSGSSSTSGSGGLATSSSGGTTTSSGNGSASTCSDAAKLVYVLSDVGDLYSFKPDTLTFTRIGQVSCPGAVGYNSMAVDRAGTAWVNGQDGALYKVSTHDASCQTTSFSAGFGGFSRFGMAFSADTAGGNQETLYVADNNDLGLSSGLAKIDTTTLQLTRIGDFSSPLGGKSAELTGTGDAKLFGFFTTSPARLAEVTKATAATPKTQQLSGVNTGEAFAFSFWGGDFWFYTAASGQTSNVTRLKAATDQSIAVVKSKIGFRIVGAGVSTCAPVTPPVN